MVPLRSMCRNLDHPSVATCVVLGHTNQEKDDTNYDACFVKGSMRHNLCHPFVGPCVVYWHTNQQKDGTNYDARYTNQYKDDTSFRWLVCQWTTSVCQVSQISSPRSLPQFFRFSIDSSFAFFDPHSLERDLSDCFPLPQVLSLECAALRTEKDKWRCHDQPCFQYHLRVEVYRILCEQDFSIREYRIAEIFFRKSRCTHRGFNEISKKISSIQPSRIEKSCSHEIR